MLTLKGLKIGTPPFSPKGIGRNIKIVKWTGTKNGLVRRMGSDTSAHCLKDLSPSGCSANAVTFTLNEQPYVC
jgi:hypothetical protein